MHRVHLIFQNGSFGFSPKIELYIRINVKGIFSFYFDGIVTDFELGFFIHGLVLLSV